MTNRICWSVGLAAAITLASSWRDFTNLPRLASPAEWTPMKAHAAGVELARAAEPGPILTLAPITPLEGGRPIYRALVASPFSWKTAKFLSEEERRRFGFAGAPELGVSFPTESPSAICTGGGEKADSVLLRYAEMSGAKALELANGETAWIKNLDARSSALE